MGQNQQRLFSIILYIPLPQTQLSYQSIETPNLDRFSNQGITHTDLGLRFHFLLFITTATMTAAAANSKSQITIHVYIKTDEHN